MRVHLRKIIVGVIVLAALTAVVYRSRHKMHLADFTWRKFIHAVGQANITYLLLSILAIYACYAIRALRWQRFSRHLGPSGFWNTYSATIMGFAAIFILARPGEPVRPLLLARKNHFQVSSMFGIWVLERLFDFASAVILACLSVLVFSGMLIDAGANSDWIDNVRKGAWILAGLLLALTALLVYFRLHGAGELDRRLVGWRARGGWRRTAGGIIGGFSQGLQAIKTVPDLLFAIFYSAAHWGLVALIYLFVCQAFGDAFSQSDMNYPGAMLLLAVTLVGSTLQLPGIGGGAQIATLIALTQIFGVEQEPATAIAVALWVITFSSCILIGVPLLIHEGFSMGDLRKLAREESKAERAGTHVPAERVPLAGEHSAKTPLKTSKDTPK